MEPAEDRRCSQRETRRTDVRLPANVFGLRSDLPRKRQRPDVFRGEFRSAGDLPMKAKTHVPVVVAMVFACAAVGAAAVPGKTIQVWTRYWTVPPDLWKGHQDWAVPEKAALDHRKVKDLGIAFSGGGTRSAAATLGELRGLYENGWLKNVRYMTAVSGGSWTSVPFVYSTA